MICVQCGSEVAAANKFCGDCGAPMLRQCGACGTNNPTDKKFCGECGTALTHAAETPAAAPAPGAERRLISAVFVDLVGSTELGSRLDPEDMREVIAAFQGCVTGQIARFEGFVARYMGDGVLVYFGYPQAQEDDAERAVRAALAIIEAVNKTNTIAGPPGTLRVRVGIATGLVVVGDLIGSGSSLESSAVGDTLNLAARLQSLAEPGVVVIAEDTRRLIGGLFEYDALAPAQLKGWRNPVQAWAVLRESAIDSRFEALRTGERPLIGRQEEIELLSRRWEQSRSGAGRVVLLSGEPGIGKSRLIAALEESIRATPHVSLRFLCSPHHLDTPLDPIVRQLTRVADLQPGDSDAVKRDKLTRALPADASPQDVRLIAELLSIPVPGGEARPATPQQKREMTFAAILRQFESVARRSPLLIVIEDMHWADPSSLDLLTLLVDKVERLPVLVVITTRPVAQPPWVSRAHVTMQLLSTLDRDSAKSLISTVTGDQTLPDQVIDRIIGHADGVPLFIEELTKTVLESSQRDGHDGPHNEPLSADAVPKSLYASLMARLDRLSAGKEAAQIGSVLGREFSFETLGKLFFRPALQLVRAMSELVDTGLVTARGQPPDAIYTFKHALIQDAAYASLLRDRRRAIHLRVAEILENGIGGIMVEPQLIAWHFAQGGAPDKSISYYAEASERATGRFALAEMVSHLRSALGQVKGLPRADDQLRHELALQVALGRALIDHQGSGSEQVRTVFERARELSLTADDAMQLVRVHDGLINYYFTHSAPREMLRHADELLEVGKRKKNAQALLVGRRTAGFAKLLLGRFADANDDMQSFLSMYDPERDGPQAGLTTRDPKVSICTMLGICLTARGYPRAGAAMSLEGVRHAETSNHVVSLILGLRRACVEGMVQRDVGRVIELSDRLLSVASEYDTFKGLRDGVIFQGWARWHFNKDTALLERMDDSIQHFDATKHWALLPFFMAVTAEIKGDNGDVDGAVALLDRALELVCITGEAWSEPEIIRLQARFGARDADEAEGLLHKALAKAQEQGAKLWELRAATSLGELWQEQGRTTAAHELLAPVFTWFTEGHDKPDLVAARHLLDTTSQQGRRAS
jgi:class 3 adenylate cyclase